jgi:hypothetical protein
MQRRSRGRIAVGSTDKVTAIQASLSLRLNGSENQSQVAESILPRQACPAGCIGMAGSLSRKADARRPRRPSASKCHRNCLPAPTR